MRNKFVFYIFHYVLRELIFYLENVYAILLTEFFILISIYI